MVRGWLWIAAGLFLTGSAAGADECALKRVAQFDMELHAGTPVIEVMLNGQPAKMVVDTGAAWSGVSSKVAEGLHAKRVDNVTLEGAGGGALHQIVIVPEFDLGPVKQRDFQFSMNKPGPSDDDGIAGQIGANILQKFDVEIDYRGRKVVLYSPDHCPGRVISWPHDAFARLPFDRRIYTGRIVVPVTLDGHSLKALIDTGASESFAEDELASSVFSLTSTSPGAEPAGTAYGVDGRPLTLFQRRFEILELDELKFPHPLITFSTGKSEGNDICVGVGCESDAEYDLVLGGRHLRALHLYIAYREHAVYATTAN